LTGSAMTARGPAIVASSRRMGMRARHLAARPRDSGETVFPLARE
jgi:hypothetical protein